MIAYLIRRVIQMLVVLLLVSFAAFMLLYVAPGGPLEQIGAAQNTDLKLDPDLVERTMKRYDLDIYLLPRFTRWFAGVPRGPIEIGGQKFLSGLQIGCLEEGHTRLVYPDGREVETNCAKPVFMADLVGRPARDGLIRGDFGVSQQILRERPVSELISSRLGATLLLMGMSTALAIAIAVPLGVYAAVRQYSRFDYVMTGVTFFGAGMPTLFLGLLTVIVFSLTFYQLGLPYLPPNQAESARDVVVPLFGQIEAGSVGDRLWHLILPVGVLTFVSLSVWSRFIRSSMLEVLRQDYIRTARAKGMAERGVVMRHALRNSLIPFVTLLGNVLPALFAGAIITETIFSWPGMGKLFISSLLASDYPVALAFIMISTVLTLVGFLFTDLMYTIVDPRIRLS